ncbi:MAG: hypothetical protein HYV07_15625 [Deltaproteobacteria bacterium]|nr:hypothetical protein [Deltaproteobacteria bacterium]
MAHDVAFRNLLERHGYGSLDEVRAESREEGRGEGREEGREEGRRQALLAVLEARGFPADDQLRARVSSGTGATLDLWLRRAVTVDELGKLFDP